MVRRLVCFGIAVPLLAGCIDADTFRLADADAAALRLRRHYHRFAPSRLRAASARARAGVRRLTGRDMPGAVLIHLRGEGPVAATVSQASGIDVNPDALLRFPDRARGIVLQLALAREHVRMFQQRVLHWPGDDARRGAHAHELVKRLARERGWEVEWAALTDRSPQAAPAATDGDIDAGYLALEDPARRAATLLALQARPDARAEPILRALLQDWEPAVRAAAAAGLAELGRPPRDLVALLDAGIRSRWRPGLRAALPPALVRAARGTFRRQCRLALQAGADDADARVRAAARAALDRIAATKTNR